MTDIRGWDWDKFVSVG